MVYIYKIIEIQSKFKFVKFIPVKPFNFVGFLKYIYVKDSHKDIIKSLSLLN